MLQVPSLESEIGLEACRFLSSAAVNKRLVAIVEVRFMLPGLCWGHEHTCGICYEEACK